MKRIQLFTMVLLLTLFSGCATYGQRSQPYESEGKRLAYVIDLSDKLQLQWIGTTVFNNARAEQVAEGWNVADRVAENVEAVLHGSANFSQITRIKDLPKISKGAPIPGIEADVLLVFHAGKSMDTAFGTNQGYSGMGLFQRSGFGMGPYSVGTVALEAEMFDVSSGKLVRKTGASDQGGGATLLDKTMHLNAEQLSALTTTLASVANHVSTICLENLGLKPWTRPVSGQGRIREVKF
jgi:hypothetical protein